jgi:hypothetical protein
MLPKLFSPYGKYTDGGCFRTVLRRMHVFETRREEITGEIA